MVAGDCVHLYTSKTIQSLIWDTVGIYINLLFPCMCERQHWPESEKTWQCVCLQLTCSHFNNITIKTHRKLYHNHTYISFKIVRWISRYHDGDKKPQTDSHRRISRYYFFFGSNDELLSPSFLLRLITMTSLNVETALNQKKKNRAVSTDKTDASQAARCHAGRYCSRAARPCVIWGHSAGVLLHWPTAQLTHLKPVHRHSKAGRQARQGGSAALRQKQWTIPGKKNIYI